MIMERQTDAGRQFEIYISPTPSPRARRFIMEQPVRVGPRLDYMRGEEPDDIGPLVTELLRHSHISHVSLEANAITIMQDGQVAWPDLQDEVADLIAEYVDDHDPAYTPAAGQAEGGGLMASSDDPDVARILAALEPTILPYVQSHGGDLTILGYNRERHRLTISYAGTCGSCPSAWGSTLQSIQAILREQFDPQLSVSVA